jgi:hypothetical protein
MKKVEGYCIGCNKEIIHTQSFITLPNKKILCPKCYQSSGAQLPFWDKNNKPIFNK